MASPAIPLQPWDQQSTTANDATSSANTANTGASSPTVTLSTHHAPIQSQQSTSNTGNAGLQPSRPHLTSTHTSGTTLHTSASPQLNVSSVSASSPATSITTPSSTPPISSPANALPQQQTTTNTQLPQPPTNPANAVAGGINHFHRNRHSVLTYWLKPTIAVIVYFVTLGIALSATTRYTLLGLVGGTLGTWFLAILAKAGDIAFAFAVADTFDCIAWGKLKKRKLISGPQQFAGTTLGWFVAVVSSTGVVGLARILLRSLKDLRKERKTWVAPHWGLARRSRERWKRWRTTRWSFARLMFVVILIPGPGIILLADIDQRQVFFDTRGMEVSAGLALYDPGLATLSGTHMGPDISRLAQMMTRDRSITWPMDAIDPMCSASKTCKSYLIAGPYRTVQPWPFTVENETVEGFRLYNTPFYQVDMWDVDREWELSFNETKECSLYGGFDPKSEYSMKICMKQHAEGVLVAGWKSCQSGYSNTTGQCLDPASLPNGQHGWTTYLHFYRRNATVVFSRSLFTILSANDFSPPQSQNISAASLFTSTNAMLYRPNATPNDIRYDRKSLPYILTQLIGLDLWMSLHERQSGLSIGRDWLRNILTLPVYLFQTTVVATVENIPYGNENGTAPLLNLRPENHVRGSYCIVHKRAIPGLETIIAYACVAGFVLLFVGIAKWVAFRWPVIEPSEFPLLDYEYLTILVDERTQEGSLRQRLLTAQREYENSSILDEMAKCRVGLQSV